MMTIKELRNNVSKIIETNDLGELQSYIKENNVNLKLMNKKNFDILIYAIEYNSSLELINFIIHQCTYKTLDYYLYKKNFGNISPLLFAIMKNNYEVANLLLEKNANINYIIGNEDLFDCLLKQQKLNDERLDYLLSHNIKAPSSYFINNLFKNSKNSILEKIIKHYNFENTFVLNFLSYYTHQIPISKTHLKNILSHRIEFNETMYNTSLSTENYTALNLLFKYDIRKKIKQLNNLFKILDSNPTYKYSLLEKVTNKTIKIPVDKYFIDNLSNIQLKREIIMQLIKENKIDELNNFINENRFSLSYFNNDSMDILMFAINNDASYEMMKLIINHCPYKTLNYTVEFNHSPLLSALSKKNYKLADLLIQNGADINYTVSFERIIYYLYFRQLDPKLLKYLLKHRVELSYNTFDLMEKLIESSQNHFIEIIFNHYIYDRAFILAYLNFYKNKTTLSKKQLNYNLSKEKNKLKIRNNWYKAAIIKKNYKALRLLVNYDSRKNYEAIKLLSELNS